MTSRAVQRTTARPYFFVGKKDVAAQSVDMCPLGSGTRLLLPRCGLYRMQQMCVRGQALLSTGLESQPHTRT